MKKAIEYLELETQLENKRDTERFNELSSDTLVQYLIKDSLLNVLVPAGKLWNTGYGATILREAVSLMGGYGITEDCPGFLGQKWMDAQLEATYEGPEAVQRRQLSVTITNEIFLKRFEIWITEMRTIASRHPDSGAYTLASAMELWLWTLKYLMEAKDAEGKKLYLTNRQGVTFPMADAICWLVASRSQIMDYLELEAKGPESPTLADGLEGFLGFFCDLCHVQTARCAGEVGRICTELVFGYNHHSASENKEINFQGHDAFVKLRNKLDACLTGVRLAKDRAANALTEVMIPEALDYPA